MYALNILWYLLFSVRFLERTGISNFFIQLANCIAGKYAGGPAKVAVISLHSVEWYPVPL